MEVHEVSDGNSASQKKSKTSEPGEAVHSAKPVQVQTSDNPIGPEYQNADNTEKSIIGECELNHGEVWSPLFVFCHRVLYNTDSCTFDPINVFNHLSYSVLPRDQEKVNKLDLATARGNLYFFLIAAAAIDTNDRMGNLITEKKHIAKSVNNFSAVEAKAKTSDGYYELEARANDREAALLELSSQLEKEKLDALAVMDHECLDKVNNLKKQVANTVKYSVEKEPCCQVLKRWKGRLCGYTSIIFP
ncbi:hypothetical protein FRX31_003176 [Thalictrum thalictroides]|uniref:Uncharacterized protein n=1 Tax=Thalictrum thalictroides TaxID=46969 RepID=A0A7J6XE00_THATH|nr:hypothetical protein FRX31_003176 [Thalictrum thalictroides]